MDIKKVCEGPWCNKTFMAHSWDIIRNRGRFCSRKCVGHWLSLKRTRRPEKKINQAG